MPYALYSNDVKISKAFATKSEVWQHAAETGLVMDVSSREEDPPRRILNLGYAIHACAPDASAEQTPVNAKTAINEREMAQLVVAHSVNPRSAVVAS